MGVFVCDCVCVCVCVADVGVRPGGRARLVMHATSISQHQNSELHQRLARMTAYERIGRCVMLTGTPQGGVRLLYWEACITLMRIPREGSISAHLDFCTGSCPVP